MRHPSEFHPELTSERLISVARTIAEARTSALEVYDEDEGDDGWSLGCQAYTRARNRIKAAAYSGEHPWLTIINPTLKFIFAIGGVPIRFYRGDATDPKPKILQDTPEEQAQLELHFPDEPKGTHLKWRLAVDADVDGKVQRVVCIGVTSTTSIECSWDIPLNTTEEHSEHTAKIGFDEADEDVEEGTIDWHENAETSHED